MPSTVENKPGWSPNRRTTLPGTLAPLILKQLACNVDIRRGAGLDAYVSKPIDANRC
jgi:hypothetical protein